MLRVLMMLVLLGKLDALLPLEGAAPPAGEPETAAAAVEPAEPIAAEPAASPASVRPPDPNYSRLMLVPSGRPLRKGDGYFSLNGLVYPGVAAFPGFTVGLTDNISLAGGVSMIPGIGLGQQVFFATPSVGFTLSDKAAVSFGVFLAGSSENGVDPFGLGFVVGTFGKPDASLTVGLATAGELDGFDEMQPILILGGQVRVARSVAIVTESWLILNGMPLSQQPFGVAARFFGERLSADIGLVIIGAELEDGFAIPWISISYHFGPGRGPRRAPPPAPMLTRGSRRP